MAADPNDPRAVAQRTALAAEDETEEMLDVVARTLAHPASRISVTVPTAARSSCAVSVSGVIVIVHEPRRPSTVTRTGPLVSWPSRDLRDWSHLPKVLTASDKIGPPTVMSATMMISANAAPPLSPLS